MVQSLHKNWLLVSKITWGILDNFRQALESPKSWNLMGYFCPKNTFLQLKNIYRGFSTQLLVWKFTKLHMSLYNFSRHNSSVFVLTQTLNTFYKSSPNVLLYFFSWNFICYWQKQHIKVQIFRLATAHVKIHQVPQVIFGTKSQFSSKLSIIL